MLAKVIAWAPTRAEAASRLAGALVGTQIHGVTTNRDLLVRVLRHPEFLAGRTDTAFLPRHDPMVLGAPLADADVVRRHAIAAALSGQAARRATAGVQPTLPSGWRNVATGPQRVAFVSGDQRVEVGYRFSRDGLSVSVDGASDVVLWSAAPDHVVDITVDGLRSRVSVHQVGPVWYVDSNEGSSTLIEEERFPLPQHADAVGSLLAPMPGAVTRVLVATGADVNAGDTLLVLEAMKMEHPVRAPHAGRVSEVRVTAGQQVDTGAVLVVLEES
jgi:propionyl-CoA carboxylase alpha chain